MTWSRNCLSCGVAQGNDCQCTPEAEARIDRWREGGEGVGEHAQVLMCALAGNVICPCVPFGSRSMIDVEQIVTDLTEAGWKLEERNSPAEWITRLTASLGELAQEHNQGAQAGVSQALDAHIRLALRWREERDAA